jgi:hypothetical protein
VKRISIAACAYDLAPLIDGNCAARNVASESAEVDHAAVQRPIKSVVVT